MASKKTQKITKVPSGKSFMFVPRSTEKVLTPCPSCRENSFEMTGGGFPTCNEHSAFACDECGRVNPRPEMLNRVKTQKQFHHVCTDVILKQRSKKQTKAFVEAFRAEKRRRMEILHAERAKFPPSLLKKGKRWVNNPKFTDKMRQHMHTFAVIEEDIAAEIIASGIPRWVEKKGV